jgi:Lrp/AsnC family transcriptional regulator, leucine-responsive regulatory protein
MANPGAIGRSYAMICRRQGRTVAVMSSEGWDLTDRAILDHLQRDGRVANVDLAEAVSLSPSASLRRTRALERAGVITGYRAELDRTRLGLGLTVFLELKVDGHTRENSDRVERALTAIPAVVACYIVSGDADILVEAAVPDLASYERLLMDELLAIPSINDVRSAFAIRTIRSRGPLPLRHWPPR